MTLSKVIPTAPSRVVAIPTWRRCGAKIQTVGIMISQATLQKIVTSQTDALYTVVVLLLDIQQSNALYPSQTFVITANKKDIQRVTARVYTHWNDIKWSIAWLTDRTTRECFKCKEIG